jgi:hypothetical protein
MAWTPMAWTPMAYGLDTYGLDAYKNPVWMAHSVKTHFHGPLGTYGLDTYGLDSFFLSGKANWFIDDAQFCFSRGSL